MPNFTQNQLQKITSDIFEAGGVPSDEAEIIGELLVASNLAGHDSHGVLRIPQYIGLIESGLIQPGAPMHIERESASHAAHQRQLGFWTRRCARKAMSLAIGKATVKHYQRNQRLQLQSHRTYRELSVDGG